MQNNKSTNSCIYINFSACTTEKQIFTFTENEGIEYKQNMLSRITMVYRFQSVTKIFSYLVNNVVLISHKFSKANNIQKYTYCYKVIIY